MKKWIKNFNNEWLNLDYLIKIYSRHLKILCLRSDGFVDCIYIAKNNEDLFKKMEEIENMLK